MSQFAPRQNQAAQDSGSGQLRSSNIDDSPTVGRVSQNHKSPLYLGSPTGPNSRSIKPPVPSPLSGTSNLALMPEEGENSYATNFLNREPKPARIAVDQGTFYTDSSNPSSPEPEHSKLKFPNAVKETRSVSDPLISKPPANILRTPVKSTMDSPTGASFSGPSTPIPRNSSIDSAISAVSPQSPTASSPSHAMAQPLPDITNLIQTAGSPEAAIHHLLKDKQSQSQQNNQLWRLVDKQRAMILGLNKDLEAALKEKEKYRKKLKELISNPAILKAAGGQSNVNPKQARDRPKDGGAILHPDSPVLEADGQKHPIVDTSLAPYPITPPADRPQLPQSAVQDILNPSRTMPKAQEHASGQFDHEAEERDHERERKEKGEERLREVPYNVSLPPSRTLPSEPPKVPPPRIPTSHPHPVSSNVDRSAMPTDGISSFPIPPRKGPPAPLQLNHPTQRRSVEVDEDEDDDEDEDEDAENDSESDYDDLLDVNRTAHGLRGRRRTREEEDTKEPKILNLKDDEARSVSRDDVKQDFQNPFTGDNTPTQKQVSRDHGLAPISIHAALASSNGRQLAPPLMSPGLPASPRPSAAFNLPMISPPTSPRSSQTPVAATPVSPPPSKQSLTMHPNTPLMSSSTSSSLDSSLPIHPASSIAAKRAIAQHQPQNSLDSLASPVDVRTKIFKGLMVDEFPELLLPPNALDSVHIKVASSRMKPSRASILSFTQLEEDPVFTLAIVSLIDEGELWRVEKDLASLGKLDQRLKQCPAFTAKTPDRTLFSGHSPARLDARRIALEGYMAEILNTSLDINTLVELCKYLSTNTLPPNADETGAAPKISPDQSTQNLGPDGKLTRSGYLTKKGKNFGGWKMRFFTLDGPYLKYYETPGGPHLGTIKLQNAQVGKQPQPEHSPSRSTSDDAESQYRHAFLIGEPKKKDSSTLVKHVLCAENDRERDMWVDALLQYAEYQRPEDVEQLMTPRHNTHHDRHTFEASDNGTRSRKQTPQRSHHQTTDSDSLASIKYDATPTSDAQTNGQTRSKVQHSTSEHNNVMQPPVGNDMPHSQPQTQPQPQSVVISAPKDMHIISDAASWGNKTGGLPVPTHDEKKQKKRSFFGFGSKTRSSSDGQDSVYGGSESGSLATSHGTQAHTISLFGVSLADAARYHPPTDVNVPLPSVVYRCVQYLEANNAILEEGIFRLSGSNVVIRQIRDRFNTEGDINLLKDEQYYDIHAIASLLKLYLRELPSTILTRELHMGFLSTTELPRLEDKIHAMADLAQKLPLVNATLLKYLISFLIKIINKADVNKMNVRNVGIVFSPTLNIPAPVFALFLQNFEGIFGVDPEEYEPPIMSDGDGRGNSEDVFRHDIPGRPSTSSGSASPHRQHRLDHQARSTPTPPVGAVRPPYESHPTMIVASSTGMNMAGPGNTTTAAYETEYGMPQPTQVQDMRAMPHGMHQATPGYERHTYDTNVSERAQVQAQAQAYAHTHAQAQANASVAAYDQRSAAYNHGSMGVQHQGSQGQLRDKSLF